MTKSALFTAYNKARSAARKGASSRVGTLEVGRINRALGLAMSKGTRPYNTSLTGCDCVDRQKHPQIICKHMARLMIEYRAEHLNTDKER